MPPANGGGIGHKGEKADDGYMATIFWPKGNGLSPGGGLFLIGIVEENNGRLAYWRCAFANQLTEQEAYPVPMKDVLRIAL